MACNELVPTLVEEHLIDSIITLKRIKHELEVKLELKENELAQCRACVGFLLLALFGSNVNNGISRLPSTGDAMMNRQGVGWPGGSKVSPVNSNPICYTQYHKEGLEYHGEMNVSKMKKVKEGTSHMKPKRVDDKGAFSWKDDVFHGQTPPPTGDKCAREQAHAQEILFTPDVGMYTPVVSPSTMITYGQKKTFAQLRATYQEVIAEESRKLDGAQKWVQQVLSPSSSIIRDEHTVEPMVARFCELCQKYGLPVELQRTSPCCYKTRTNRKMIVRIINGRLMTKYGPSYVDIFDWLERQPIPTA